MLIQTRGIILRAVKYSETSIIADIYTEEKGLRSYIISGVRSKNAKISAGLLQPTALIEMIAYDREDGGLSRIKEIKAAYIFNSLPFNVLKSAVGLFIIEIARKTIKESEENKSLFSFMYDILTFLDQTKKPFANLHLSFLLGLTSWFGFLPHGASGESGFFLDLREGIFTPLIPGHRDYLDEKHTGFILQLLRLDWRRSDEVAITRSERQALLQDLLTFYRLHFENFPVIHSLDVLKEIF